MKYSQLGKTDLKVSQICLGTMTFGEQNSQRESFEQMDYALGQGVSFWDTAELYPVPPKEETYTQTETIIGNWFQSRQKRDQVILATKVAGPFVGGWIRNENDLDKKNIYQAIESSLQRLQTDYIDLYQLHWPSRPVNIFGKRDYTLPASDVQTVSILESLEALDQLQKEGKIRHYGLSNETPWGVIKFLTIAKENGFSAPASIQNPYSLLNRVYEVALAEVTHYEDVPLLAYSPLAFGVLSGKYLKGNKPVNSRLNVFPNHFLRYKSNESMSATNRYVKIAQKYSLSPVQMALAFINQMPFCAANIIGATTLPQLKENIESIEVQLSKEVIEEINKVHLQTPNPAP